MADGLFDDIPSGPASYDPVTRRLTMPGFGADQKPANLFEDIPSSGTKPAHLPGNIGPQAPGIFDDIPAPEKSAWQRFTDQIGAAGLPEGQHKETVIQGRNAIPGVAFDIVKHILGTPERAIKGSAQDVQQMGSGEPMASIEPAAETAMAIMPFKKTVGGVRAHPTDAVAPAPAPAPGAVAALDVAAGPAELNHPGYKLHPLKGDMEGHWSIWVNGNWRLTFRFVGVDTDLVDYQDYH